MASQIDNLRQNLLDLLLLLRSLSASQLQMLVNFDRREESLKPEEVIKMINHLNNSQLESVLKLTLHSAAEIQAQKQPINDKLINEFEISYIGAIGCVYRIFLLQEMIQNQLTLDQLMKIVEITPYKGFPDQQYQFLMQFQQLLGLLMPSTIASLHEDVNNGEGDELLDLLEDHQDQYLLYQPLKSFLRLDYEEVSLFCEVFPKFGSTQIVQLVRLIQLDPLNILELRQLLSPKGWMGLQTLMESDDAEMEEMNSNPFISLTILDQPSDQTVYKRNLKPFPTVMVTGDERKVLASDECLIVVPMLYRCDTLTPVPKLTGDAPVKIASGNTAKFKKLKIMVTSRQLNDTLFCLRFELRKTKIGSRTHDQAETISFIQSNPISVVSHSTLMKKLPTVVQPIINEIIPANGSSLGGNKVVIIGSNFVDSPVLRVRFDNIDVIPEFYGSGTLTCTAPQHIPGPVSVSVSNDAKAWCEIPATYIYQGESQDDLQSNAMITSTEYDYSQQQYVLSPSSKAIFDSVVKLDQSYFHSMPSNVPPDFNIVDNRGFSLMHYVAVTGDIHLAHFFLLNNANVNSRDVNGNTPLHWAILSSNIHLVPLFHHFGAPLNIPNYFGETPLHLAVSSNQPRVVEYLIQCGVNLNATNLHSQTPLHYAAVISETLVSLLLQHGANVNVLDYEGESPLHFAVREELLSVISVLLSFSAHPNVCNRAAETPFHLATLSSNTNFVFSLVNLQKFDLSSPFEHHSSADHFSSFFSASPSSFSSSSSSSSPSSTLSATTALDSFLFQNKAFLSDSQNSAEKLNTMLRSCTLSSPPTTSVFSGNNSVIINHHHQSFISV